MYSIILYRLNKKCKPLDRDLTCFSQPVQLILNLWIAFGH